MKYKFQSVHQVIGLTRSAEVAEQLLLEYPSLKARAILTYDTDVHIFELDRAAVVGLMMLKGLIGESGEGTVEERLAHELAELRAQRQRDVGSGVFVVFEADGEVAAFNPRTQRELDEFVIAIEGAPKQPIRARYQAQINGILASFALASDTVSGFKKVTDGVYFINEQNKPVYSYAFDMSGKVIVSTNLKTESTEYVRRNARLLGRRQELADAARLLARSLDQDIDELLSFLSVWAGLELFVGKAFNTYEARTFDQLTASEVATKPSKFFQRIRGVMKDKYRLVDKFCVISSILAPDNMDIDVAQFEAVKKTRDRLMHGQDVPIATLPTHETQILLRKYLKLHATALQT